MDNEQLLCAISDMLDQKLDKKLDEKLAPINSRLDRIEARLDRVEARLDKVEARLDTLESDVKALKDGQAALSRDVKVLDAKVTEAYQFALDAWGKSTENRYWIQNSRIKLE